VWKQPETSCSPIICVIGQQVTECDLEGEVVKYLGHEVK